VKITLIHNPDAFRGEADDSELRRIFLHAGHDLTYINIQESDWQRTLSPETERVIIAGGDGTVQSIAPQLKGKPFSILPIGTANNTARCLSQTSNAELLASHLDQAEIRHLDLGVFREGNGSKSFLEIAGMGVLAELILEMQESSKQKKMEQAESRQEKFGHALEQLVTLSRTCEGTAWELKVDETIIADRFLLIAAMNLELAGPNLRLAPGADPNDGYLDLVCVRERERENLSHWIEGQAAGQVDTAHFERWRCRRVEARASDNYPSVHIDSQLVQEPKFPIVIELEPAALDYAVVGWD
jgi:diacylglycerol kinase (ATP)